MYQFAYFNPLRNVILHPYVLILILMVSFVFQSEFGECSRIFKSGCVFSIYVVIISEGWMHHWVFFISER